jgi:hypothetical protein
MNDSPAASIAFWPTSEIMSASATTMTSGSRCADMSSRIADSVVLVSAMLASKAWTISGNPSWPVSRPMVICGSSAKDHRILPGLDH